MVRRFLTVAAALLTCWAVRAQAADLPGTIGSADCTEEIQKVCHGDQQDIDVCVATQGAQISAPCRQEYEQYKDARVMMHDNEGPGACASDLQSLCPSTSVHAIRKCLERQMENMPISCRTALASVPQLLIN
jgi:hypothetical protein